MGKYIHLFQTQEEHDSEKANNYVEPWVSYTEQGDVVDYNKKNYFTIEANEDATTVYFRQSPSAYNNDIAPLTVEVSTDGGETWTEKTARMTVGELFGTVIAELDAGEKVLIKGNNQAYGYYDEGEDSTPENCNFWADGPCYVYGNIMSLVGGDNYALVRSVSENAFSYFFSDYGGGLNPWVLSKDEEPLILPATTLGYSCYNAMFYGCTTLTTAPELPATTMATGCYSEMFSGCTGLATAPALPATTLANYCYSMMFADCTALTTAPELPATTMATGCYGYMFSGCTGLTTAPALSATTLVIGCYSNMFVGCTNLTSAPVLLATTLAENCYTAMFKDCSKLNYVKAMFTTTPGGSYTGNWLKNVAATGTFVKNSAATWNVTGADGVPTGWTVETASE